MGSSLPCSHLPRSGHVHDGWLWKWVWVSLLLRAQPEQPEVPMPREGCWKPPHCLKHHLTWPQRRAWAVPKLSPGKGWLAALRRLSPLLIPSSASSGLLPSRAFFKMQGYLLPTAYLHPQLSQLLQHKLQLLGLLCPSGLQIPAGTGKQEPVGGW